MRDPERGRAKELEVCLSCHGEQGVAVVPEVPNLAGQSGAAIYKQLHDYRTDSRTHPQMSAIAKALEDAQIADVAAYYAGQPKRNPNPATLAESPAAIVRPYSAVNARTLSSSAAVARIGVELSE